MTTGRMTSPQRIDAAIALEKPDRVPIIPMMDFFAARSKGVTMAKFINDNDLGRDLLEEVFDDLGGWDATFQGTTLNEFAFALTVPVRMKVPGRELPPDEIWQFVETPVMTVEDYDTVIDKGWNACWAQLFPKVRPEIPLHELPERMQQWEAQAVKDTLAWEAKGVLTFTGVALIPPFEMFSMARSLNEFTLDLYRRPEKVVAAMDAAMPDLLQTIQTAFQGMRQTTKWGFRTAFIGGTRASATFLSPKQFEKFGFPYIKRMVDAYVAADITPLLHFDSNWTSFLPYFKDLPRGKCILELDGVTDIFKAKQVLAGHMCLMGDVPAALLKLGTPDQVTSYVRRLVEEVGDGGGFILSTGCDTPVDAKPENVRAMLDAGRG